MQATIHHADNLTALCSLADHGTRAHLIYGDPPFCTGQQFWYRDREMGTEELAYGDRWSTMTTYLCDLQARLDACRNILAPDGCLVLHVSSRLAYDVKPMLDAIFGRSCFEGHIIWRYRHWPTRRLRPAFEDVHDVLLRYCRDATQPPRWTQLYEPLAPSTLATWGRGRQRAVVEDGKRKRSETTREESHGAPMGNVWEIPIVAPSGHERTGYPTQKPEALLRRIVEGLSRPGDVVLDPWCGSGTTVAVAARMGREAIGIDSSEVAVTVARRRLDVIRAPQPAEALPPAPLAPTPPFSR